MLRILLVEDDIRRFEKLNSWLPDGVKLVWAKDAGVAIGILERLKPGEFSGLMLDCDLDKSLRSSDSRFLCGRDVVDALVTSRDARDIPVLVHSMNPSGGVDMAQRLAGAGFEVTRIRFVDLDAGRFRGWVAEIGEDAEGR